MLYVELAVLDRIGSDRASRVVAGVLSMCNGLR